MLKQSDIIYHFNSPLPRLLAFFTPVEETNLAVTIGVHTYVQRDYIRGHHRAHEFAHSLQAERQGGRNGFLRWYLFHRREAEAEATQYAIDHGSEFKDLGNIPSSS